jgi:UV DNA damage endonuclease
LKQTINENLNCLHEILKFNLKNKLLFFRISSDLIPFASHPVCTFAWQKVFKKKFQSIGKFIKYHSMRVSMHPDQFILINSPDKEIFHRSLRELYYHAEVLDLLGVDSTAKIQIHVGGVYGQREQSIQRFISRYKTLPQKIKRRLVIENDDRLYNINDCLFLYKKTKIPIVFDVFHFRCNNKGESIKEAFPKVYSTWKSKDGLPIVDYSSQDFNRKPGAHTKSINVEDFREFLKETKSFDYDIMCEIKDKEKSALQAAKIIKKTKFIR